jgi:putative ABC transport system permease protein
MINSDISWLNLGIGALSLMLVIAIFYYYKTGLIKSTLIAFLRMGAQLFLVGIYLKYIFKIDNIFINLLWVLLMAIAAGFTISKRSELNPRAYFLPVFIAVIINVLFNSLVIYFLIIPGGSYTKAQYMIPITGMLIGNSISSTVVGLRTLYRSLDQERDRYRYDIMCGATKDEAIFPFITEAMRSAFNPMIANTATIGLIWLPGMMTGQILAGSDPSTAIRYQAMIMLTVFVASVITLHISILLSKRKISVA